MTFLRSALFALFFYLGTIPFVLLTFPGAVIGPRSVRAVVRGWALYHRWCSSILLGIRARVEGHPPEGPALVAAKHQSMFETIEMVLILREPALVMKRELADIPLWGWAARRYGIIVVDRKGGAAALRRMMREAEAAIAEGRPIVIFPEGTRVPPGSKPPLQPGFAGLYRALGLPCVPLALDSGLLWPRHSFVKHSGTITMRFAPPIAPGLPRKEIEAQVLDAINVLERAG